MKDYPVFIIPGHLADKSPDDWTTKEAREYKEYLLSIIDDRTDYLKVFLSLSEDAGCEAMLLQMGEKAVPLLKSPQYSVNRQEVVIVELKGHKIEHTIGWDLTPMGRSLAADMGLLVAKCLLKKLGDKIHWDIVKKPKRDVSYNHPVLMGFKVRGFDPIRVSIAVANSVLNERSDANIWLEIYKKCITNIQ